MPPVGHAVPAHQDRGGELSPAQLVLLRTGLAAVLLVPWAAYRGQLLPALRRWRPLLAFTALELAAPRFLLADAERTLTAR